ncbi:hypothetical protein [Streptomyces prunicolor]|uniref:BMP family ABC transporter substrate-binding protein n=1 Tax=Streptomyces prunicolor TaxID=67348 RepID=A0ABU4FGK5_9ACTN|nr:hypothetical protein [Streptomyces prunicolor]MDV7219128.1 hypothetical protein [Streptomyces prunicolor]
MPVPTIARLVGGVRRRPLLVGGGAVTAVVVAVTLSLLLSGNDAPSPRANNVSRNFRACLLVSPTNATDAGLARAAWQGMQRAAAAGHVNAQRFPTPTIDAKAALPYINGAVQQHCGLIIAVGTGMKPATEAAATANPHQRFALVGGASSHPRIASVAATDDSKGLSAKVESLIARLTPPDA